MTGAACPPSDSQASQGRQQVASGIGWVPPQPPPNCGLFPFTTGGLTYWFNQAQINLINSRPWPGALTNDVFALGGTTGGTGGVGSEHPGTPIPLVAVLGAGVLIAAIVLLWPAPSGA